MNDLLAKLFFLAPPSNTPWKGPSGAWSHPNIKRTDGVAVELDLPLFWYDPPWYQLAIERADSLAVAVGSIGVMVSALERDLHAPDGSSIFHSGHPVDEEGEDQPERPSARMVPYRPERYGLSNADFEGARVIDLRLTRNRDESGRFAYCADQIERWAATPSGEPVSGGSWVPSATFPPDVASLHQLGTKLDQLRVLSPDAAVFVSISAHRLETELPAVIETRPDGLILRFDDIAIDGLDLASMTYKARRLLDHLGASDLPMWVVPGKVSADDAAKLIALGAAAVAIDGWCEGLLESAAGEDRSAAARLGYSSAIAAHASHMSNIVSEELQPRVDRFVGLLSSIQSVVPDQRLASLNNEWCKRLGLQTRNLSSS